MTVVRVREANTSAVQRVAGIAAMACAMLWITAFIFIVAVWPLYDVKSTADVADPGKILPAVANHPVLAVFNLLDMPLAVCLQLVARGLHVRSPRGVPATLARTGMLISAVCFFALGALRLGGFAWLGSLYTRDPVSATSAYGSFYALQSALDAGAILALGCWLALTNWLGLRSHRLPVPLAYFGLVAAMAALVASAVHAIQPVGLVLVLIWFGWLGVALLRSGRPVSLPEPVASPG